MHILRQVRTLARLALPWFALSACGESAEPFELRFALTDGDTPLGCDRPLENQGPNGDVRVGISDVRFYVSNLRAYDAAGAELVLDLAESDFQYRSDAGEVALVDLTGITGDCAASSVAFAEGTARSNDRVVGEVFGEVARVTFDVGVPQPLMKAVVADFSAEGAPSPLSELHWSWASAHRHFVFNFSVDGPDGAGDGYLHVGSRECGGDGARALTDRDECGRINTASVDIDLGPEGEVGVDLSALVAELDFVAPVYDRATFEVIGEGPGVECHSAADIQPDCVPIFQSLGINPDSGAAAAASNAVFYAR